MPITPIRLLELTLTASLTPGCKTPTIGILNLRRNVGRLKLEAVLHATTRSFMLNLNNTSVFSTENLIIVSLDLVP